MNNYWNTNNKASLCYQGSYKPNQSFNQPSQMPFQPHFLNQSSKFNANSIIGLLQQLISVLQRGGSESGQIGEPTLDMHQWYKEFLLRTKGGEIKNGQNIEISDHDKDGKLSVGDVLNQYGGTTGRELVASYILTEHDLLRLTAQSYSPGPGSSFPEVDITSNQFVPSVETLPVSAGNGMAKVEIGVRNTFDLSLPPGEGRKVLEDNEVVNIAGRDYTIGFLKSQANGYTSSVSGDFNSTADAQFRAWGSGSGASVRLFEDYIVSNFPNGEPFA